MSRKAAAHSLAPAVGYGLPRAVTSWPALMMPRKSLAFRLAPPTRAPSMSGLASSSAALSGFTLPPYWTTTRAAVASPNVWTSQPRMKA